MELGRYGLEPRVSCWVHKPQKIYTFGFVVGNIIPKSCTVYPLSYWVGLRHPVPGIGTLLISEPLHREFQTPGVQKCRVDL